jgi:outer membrane protein insertion porin family
MKTLCFCFLALALSPLDAQKKGAPKKAPPAKTPPAKAEPAPTRWPIQSLRIEGNRNFTAQQVLAVAGLAIGQTAGKEEFEQARNRLVDSGAFESVGYRFEPSGDGKGFTASFQVVEVEPAYPVRFRNFAIGDAELAALLRARDPLFGPKIPGTAPFLTRYAEVLTEKTGEEAIGRVVAVGPDQFEIVFQPDRPVPVVAQVIFQGNQVIPTPLLSEKISGVAYGFPYTEERFRQLLDTTVRPLYDARGRIRVKFPKISAKAAKDVKALEVTVAVEEGESFSLGEVKIAGGDPGLLKVANIQSGDIANFDDVNAGIERVKQALARRGYLRAEVRPEREIHDKSKTVDVTLRVTPGPQFSFGKLTIEGLDIIGEPAVRRMWGMKPGAPFDVEYPQKVLDRVREEHMFDNLGKTSSKLDINEETHTVDVTLKFAGEERPKKKEVL